ncbi:MAG: trimethylamine methyltransferase family protein [Pseudomonadota bacterium]|nr:trimethylamine methyltransferase family protein [Pseudomonadota bacterium]
MNAPTRPVRRGRKTKPASELPDQIGWGDIRNRMAPLAPLSDDQIEAIHLASLRLLEDYGIEVMSAPARALFGRAGAEVDEATQIVRVDREIIETAVAKAPSSFTLTPTNPARALTVGGNHIHFGLVSGAPNAHDIRGGRRSGNFDDYRKLMKLGQSFNVIHFFGNQTLAPNDLPVNTRHLDTTFVNLTLTDKVFLSMSIGAGRVRDAARLTAIARGLTMDQLAADPSSITNININSPRKLDTEMASAAMAMAEMGQAAVITPFTLMGAMTPVTLAAALAQQNAEALFGIAMTQLVRPGAPVVYGGFTSNVDMKTGAPAFGTPENTLANIAGGQLARRYGLPYRTSACSASNAVDAQAVWETQMALWGAVTGHGNLIYHSAGWGEGGLVADFEKLIVDCEMLQAMSEFLEPRSFTDADFGFDAHDEVAPGGHFFGAAHTMERYQSAFYSPFLSDWSNNENWRDAGARTTTERAMEIWPKIIEAYEPPTMDPARIEEMQVYIATRREAIGSDEP